MKAITIGDIIIHCDSCSHEFYGMPKQWLNKNCPECGAEKIITQEDLDILETLNKNISVINDLIGDVPADSLFEDVKINSYQLRKKED